MLTIEICEKTRSAPVFPYENKFPDCDAGSFVSTLAMEALLGSRIHRVGDSEVYVELMPTGEGGEKGLEEFENMAKNFYGIVADAICQMSERYRQVYEAVLEDYHENGIIMPYMEM